MKNKLAIHWWNKRAIQMRILRLGLGNCEYGLHRRRSIFGTIKIIVTEQNAFKMKELKMQFKNWFVMPKNGIMLIWFNINFFAGVRIANKTFTPLIVFILRFVFFSHFVWFVFSWLIFLRYSYCLWCVILFSCLGRFFFLFVLVLVFRTEFLFVPTLRKLTCMYNWNASYSSIVYMHFVFGYSTPASWFGVQHA